MRNQRLFRIAAVCLATATVAACGAQVASTEGVLLGAIVGPPSEVRTVEGEPITGTQSVQAPQIDIPVAKPTVEPPMDAIGAIVDVDLVAQTSMPLVVLPDAGRLDVTVDLGEGNFLRVETSTGPEPLTGLICVVQHSPTGPVSSACGDPAEIGGLISFNVGGHAVILSAFDQKIDFADSGCRTQMESQIEPYKLQVCETVGEFAYVNAVTAEADKVFFEMRSS